MLTLLGMLKYVGRYDNPTFAEWVSLFCELACEGAIVAFALHFVR